MPSERTAEETAEPNDRCDTLDGLRRSIARSILVERKVRAHPIVVGSDALNELLRK
jgi:hypothetical protein